MSFGHDVYQFSPGAEKKVGDVVLRLTEDADFQVVKLNTVLWHSGTTVAGCSAACRVVFQSDGNLVLQGPAGVLWSSGTSAFPGATLIFQPNDPYLTIRDANYEVAWTSNGNDVSGAAGMLTGALTGSRAASVRSFLDTLAVNTHMDQYEGDARKVYDRLNYLGVSTLRDHYSEDGRLFENYVYLAERGVQFDMLHYSNDFNVLMRDAQTMAGLPSDALIAVEGPNEINNFPFTCDGSTWSGGRPNNNGPAAQCFMETYYKRLKENAELGSVDVYDLTGGTSVLDPDEYGLLTLAGRADLGNIHAYPGPTEQPRGTLLRNLGGSYFAVPPNGAVITETGYTTSQVSQRAQALYYLNLYLDAFQAGFRKTYMYELTDNSDESYGFFDTAGEPKVSATALRNLTGILADSGAPRDGTLEYSVSGMPKEARVLALQRSTGAFNMVLWDERSIWSGVDIEPPMQSVSIDLGKSFSEVSVYLPSTSSAVQERLRDVATVTIQLAGEPVVLELVP